MLRPALLGENSLKNSSHSKKFIASLNTQSNIEQQYVIVMTLGLFLV